MREFVTKAIIAILGVLCVVGTVALVMGALMVTVLIFDGEDIRWYAYGVLVSGYTLFASLLLCAGWGFASEVYEQHFK